MVTAHEEHVWIHTATTVQTLINSFRDPKSQPVKFADVYPFGKRAAVDVQGDFGNPDDVAIAKAAWLSARRG